METNKDVAVIFVDPVNVLRQLDGIPIGHYANIKHGHNIRYWMVGNESWHPQISNYYTVEDYIADLKLFSDAMKAIDPSILIIANTAPWVPDFSRRIFSGASDKFDMVCISNYSTNNNSRGQYQTWAAYSINVYRTHLKN